MLSNQRFERKFLRPRYWLLWIGLGILYLLVLLPYPLIYRLGHGLGRIAMRLMKRRVKIARRNVELCFPEMLAAVLSVLLPLAHTLSTKTVDNLALAPTAYR